MLVEEWLSDLCDLPDEAWAEHLRRQDPLANLVSSERYLELYRGSDECGRARALALVAPGGPADPGVLARELGARVSERPYAPDAGRPTFACFFEPDQIELYADNIDATQDLLDEGGLSSVTGEVRVRDILLAHELFHVDALRARDAGQTLFCNEKHVELGGINRLFGRRSSLPTLEEAAAMGFARQLSGCPCNPFVLNFLMLLPADPDRAAGLYREVSAVARELGVAPRGAEAEGGLPACEKGRGA